MTGADATVCGIAGYAAIGDGRTVALVSPAGSVDWLCLPELDSESMFGALLDPGGGQFELAPEGEFRVTRRYVPGTNILQTTFHTAACSARVTDALTVPDAGLGAQRELVRVVDGIDGRVSMRWRMTPRFGYGQRRTRIFERGGIPVATAGADALALCSWGAGAPRLVDGSVRGDFTVAPGERAVLALSAAHQEPLIIPARGDVLRRLDATRRAWRGWSERLPYLGRWTDAAKRSALVLKMLVHAPSGAIAAAATTSLPETIGGERNWDYRYCWLRDSAFVLEALLGLGCTSEADAFFWWMMHASQLTHPRLRVLYRLDGGPSPQERTLPLAGFRGSRPVRVGNGAAGQLQLDVYGDLFHAAWLYAQAGRTLDADIGRRLGEMADLVCRIWRSRDAGLWEVRSAPEHFTQSKMMCAIALDRAVQLADAGVLPSRHRATWVEQAGAIRSFVDGRCWSAERGSYVRSADGNEMDAGLLVPILFGYDDPSGTALAGTVEAIRRELADGPYVRRYSGYDGLTGGEGAFLVCSFWLAEALALQGRTRDATALMHDLVAMANDVGLYAEEIDPKSGEFLGNTPQALTHLGVIRTALALSDRNGAA